MDSDNLDELRQELKEALHAIEILTERLINLAVIENKFINLADRMNIKESRCHNTLFHIQSLEEKINQKMESLDCFFSFRYKWMERLIIKRKYMKFNFS